MPMLFSSRIASSTTRSSPNIPKAWPPRCRYPKTVRASAGSVFRLPVLKTSAPELLAELRSRQIRALALVAPHNDGNSGDGRSPRSPLRLRDADLASPCALFIGNEGAGI